jgi:sodium transport system permease protein
MGPIRTVFAKEVLENLRDRRVIFSAFFFGVLLAPALFALTTTLASNRITRDQDRPLQLPVVGGEQAPNLMRFLRENGAQIAPVILQTPQTPDQDAGAVEVVRSGRRELVLIIPPQYAEKLKAGDPAPLDLVVDTSNSSATAATERARRLLDAYGRQVAALRLLVRGISPEVVAPVDVRTVDVATPAGRSLLILGMMTYFCLMSMLVGGFYLAIDTTAGERERGSLEPLLALPVTRGQLLMGKMLATSAFMAMSLLLTLSSFGVALAFVPLEVLGMSANFGPLVILEIFCVMVTFVPLGAGLMTVVASFTRSNREAQTWLSFVLLIPLAPIMFAVLNGTRATDALMAIPSLSQHLLATALMRGDAITLGHVVISTSTTLLAGALLVWLAVRLYRRETILG